MCRSSENESAQCVQRMIVVQDGGKGKTKFSFPLLVLGLLPGGLKIRLTKDSFTREKQSLLIRVSNINMGELSGE